MERPRGDKVLADHGARRELTEALGEGVHGHVRDVRRRLPGVDRLVVQLDEPALAAVAAGGVPTASGFSRHRSVAPPELLELLGLVLAAVTDAGAEPWLHCCAAGAPLDLAVGAGARGASVDLDRVDAAGHEALAEALDAGLTVALGVVPATDPSGPVGDAATTERVLRWLDMAGLEPEQVSASLVLTPACGMAGASPAYARTALRALRTAASNVAR